MIQVLKLKKIISFFTTAGGPDIEKKQEQVGLHN